MGLMAGFEYLAPLRRVTERLVCEPDERLVTETKVYKGGNRTGVARQSCCAERSDTRSFGRCNWGGSIQDSSEVLVLFVPLGISLGVATIVAGILLLVLIVRYRRVYRWARRRARETGTVVE
jgi:hypothetical protein